jgi:hypothetical protein
MNLKYKNKIKIGNYIGSIMVSVLASSVIDCIVGTNCGLVKQKNIKLVFVASPLRTQHVEAFQRRRLKYE